MTERYIPCPKNGQEDCKYFPNCHTSEHHLFPRRTVETPLQKRFGNLAINKVVSCRNVHDLLDTLPPPDYPSEDKMREALDE